MAGIKSLFDLVDGALSAFESASGVAPASSPPPSKVGRSRGADSTPNTDARGAIATRQFRVVDSIDGDTGSPSWVVTDGRDRAECSSAGFAQRVRDALG